MREDTISPAEAALDGFIADGRITEVVRPLKSGKEATVWLVRGRGGKLLAAKVYAQRRHLRSGGTYDDGRQFLDERAARAVRKGSDFGREAELYRWVQREYERLVPLHAAGVALPKPIGMEGRAILMAYLGDEDEPAPRLRDVRALDHAVAERALKWLLYDVELMLGQNVVHGDLSAFNVLWWQERSTVIDFPQAVDPRFNRSARMLLERDVRNVCDHFARYGVSYDAGAFVRDVWSRWMRAKL
jgi:RIO kinase 1